MSKTQIQETKSFDVVIQIKSAAGMISSAEIIYPEWEKLGCLSDADDGRLESLVAGHYGGSDFIVFRHRDFKIGSITETS